MKGILKRYSLKRSEPVLVVSGLPRSGTSMTMKMLEAAGIEAYTDAVRKADEDNPKGYLEHERVKQLQKETDKSWLRQARGKVVKVISQLLTELPDENRYKVIFMNRHLDEVIASQNKMLERRGEELGQDDGQMKTLFEKHLKKTKSWLSRQSNFETLYLDYAEVVKEPRREVAKICDFIDKPLDQVAMAAVVAPDLYRNRAQTSER